MTFSAHYSRHYNKQQEAQATKPGYYLVKPDNSRHFISTRVNVQALEQVADKVLSGACEYWIDRLIVNQWDNLDHTGRFI